MAKILKNTAVLLAIALVFSAAILGLNHVASPIIDANEAARATGALAVVLPGGTTFEALDLSTLSDIPATVTAIHKESADKGYVVELSTTSQYSAGPLTILMGVDATGAIAGIDITNYQESLQMKDEFPAHFVGQNSTLANVDMTLAAGTTFTATAFKNAVADGFAALNANGLVAEAKKSDEQILTELIPTIHTGLAKNGNLDATELGAPGVSAGGVQILSALKANNGTGFAFIAASGETKVLAVVNAGGACSVFNTEGMNVTADYDDVVTAATAAAAANADNNSKTEMEKLQRMVEGSTATAISMDGIFSTVSGVYDLGNGNYGFVARPYGFELMCIYYVLDANGAIVSMNADQFIFEKEFFMTFNGKDDASYRAGFVGLTADTFTGEQAMNATATMTSNAVKAATNDIFAAFETVKGGA